MRLDEQQINKQFNQIEEQDQLTHIHWLINKNINKSSYVRKKEEPISQWDWESDRDEAPLRRKSKVFSMLHSKNGEKVNRYAYMLNVSQSKEYELPTRKQSNSNQIKEQQIQVTPSAKKINLKLPLPKILQHSSSVDNPQQRESSLPLIKKLSIPINFLRGMEHKRQRSQLQESIYPLIIQQQSSITWEKDKQLTDIYRKGKMMMGTTRRQMKGINCFIQRPRNVQKDNDLKECITFMK